MLPPENTRVTACMPVCTLKSGSSLAWRKQEFDGKWKRGLWVERGRADRFT